MRGQRRCVFLFFVLVMMFVTISAPLGPTLAFQVQNTGGGNGDAGPGAAQPAAPATPAAPASSPGTKIPASRPAEEGAAYGQGSEGNTSLGVTKDVVSATAFKAADHPEKVRFYRLHRNVGRRERPGRLYHRR